MIQNELNEALRSVTSAWSHGDFESAYAQIQKIFEQGTQEMKGHALHFKGMIKDSEGATLDAKQAWLEALPYAEEGTFLRHNLQTGIGKACASAGLIEEARRWYQDALLTCANGDEFSGISALTALLELEGGQLPLADRNVIASVIKKSWRVHELAGTPDLNDLSGSAAKLIEGFERIVREIKETAS